MTAQSHSLGGAAGAPACLGTIAVAPASARSPLRPPRHDRRCAHLGTSAVAPLPCRHLVRLRDDGAVAAGGRMRVAPAAARARARHLQPGFHRRVRGGRLCRRLDRADDVRRAGGRGSGAAVGRGCHGCTVYAAWCALRSACCMLRVVRSMVACCRLHWLRGCTVHDAAHLVARCVLRGCACAHCRCNGPKGTWACSTRRSRWASTDTSTSRGSTSHGRYKLQHAGDDRASSGRYNIRP